MTNPYEGEVPAVVAALADVWGRWQDEPHFPFKTDHCINGARCAVDVLKPHRLTARPVSVEMALFNRFGWDLYTQGVDVREWPAIAWSLGVGPGQQRESDVERWSGHLMVEGDGWVLDLSARQFNRPGRIIAPGPVAIPLTLPPSDIWAKLTDEHKQVMLLRRWPENRGWRTAGGWRDPPSRDVMAELHRRLNAALQEEGTT